MSETEKNPRILPLVLTVVFLLVAAGLGYLGLRVLDRLDAIEGQVTTLGEEASRAATASTEALEQARRAEESARAAADGRELAEKDTLRAQETAAKAEAEATTAQEHARSAREEADAAKAEAERVRQEAEAELSRLEEALSKVVETRRTALGLVLNLGEDSIKFDFDKADLKPKDRELLSRIAGILLTSSDYTVSVNGHTDDVGTEDYNQKLSERRAEVVHRDVKPHNIMLTPQSDVKIMDFGIVRDTTKSEGLGMTQTGMIMGTPDYMSPEQAMGKADLDYRSDVYSFGVVLYEMFTGALPFRGETPISIAMKHIQEEPKAPRAVNPKVPPELEEVIKRAMRKAPEARYPRMADLLADLYRLSKAAGR